MPRTRSHTEAEITDLLQSYTGADLTYPVSVKTLYAVRNAVYRYNREHGKKFRCVIRDNDVLLTERTMKSAYENAAKEIHSVLMSAKAAGETNLDELTDLIRSALERHLSNGVDDDEEETTPTLQRKRR